MSIWDKILPNFIEKKPWSFIPGEYFTWEWHALWNQYDKTHVPSQIYFQVYDTKVQKYSIFKEC